MNDRSQEICAGAMSARFWPTTVMHVSLLALTRQLALGLYGERNGKARSITRGLPNSMLWRDGALGPCDGM